jgi:hypothetical protein
LRKRRTRLAAIVDHGGDGAMFDIGQAVLVITDKGVAYEGVIMARATGDNGGPPAYQVALRGAGQQSQWHRSSELFLPEITEPEDPNSIQNFLKK